jgi:hypothetical protein
VSDLRIAENVMGTIVGAIAGQEEATCRVMDSLMRLQAGEYRTSGSGGSRYGSFAEATSLAVNVLSGTRVAESRRELYKYFLEALRLQPQGEVLLRKCATDGARIADSRPIAAGTLVFAAHGSAMRDIQSLRNDLLPSVCRCRNDAAVLASGFDRRSRGDVR